MEEIEFKDKTGRELDVSSQQTCSWSQAQAGYGASSYSNHQTPGPWDAHRQVKAQHLGSLNDTSLTSSLSGRASEDTGARFMQDMLHFLRFSTEKEQAPVLTTEPST